MGSAYHNETYRQDAIAITQLRIDTDGMDTVCAATFARLRSDYPKELSELVAFAGVVFPPNLGEERQRFLDSKMITYAIRYAVRDLAMFAQELRIDKPLAQD